MSTPTAPTSQSLLRSFGLMASGSFVSRILGLVRQVLLTAILGLGFKQGDLYVAATGVPTLLYFLVAGGALNTVFVPQIVRAIKNSEDGGEAYINRLITLFLVGLTLISVLTFVLTPQLLYLFVDGGWRAPSLSAHYQRLTLMTALMAPQILFFGLFALGGQILAAKERFGPMMWAPVANNVVSITMFGLYAVIFGMKTDPNAVFTLGQTIFLGVGSTLAAFVQAAIVVPYLRRAGVRYRFDLRLRGSGLGHTMRVAVWVLGSVVVTQIASLVISRMATSATAKGFGAGKLVYDNGLLIWMIPQGLITVSVTTALLPAISRFAAANNVRGVRTETNRALRLTSSLIVPISVLMAVLAYPISDFIYGFSHKSAAGVGFLAWTLAAFMVGMPAYTTVYVITRMFYALEDTRTTFLLDIVLNTVNVVLGVGFLLIVPNPRWSAPLLALSLSLAILPELLLMFRLLQRKVPGITLTATLRYWTRLALASLPAAGAAWSIIWLLERVSNRWIMRIPELALSGLVALAVFYVGARILHINEINDVVARLLRRGTATADTPAGNAEITEDRVNLRESVDNEAVAIAAIDEVSPPHDTAQAGPTGAEVVEVDQQREDLSALPNPFADPDELADGPVAQVEPEQVLADRYQLERLLLRRGRTLTWRAQDLTLSRPVLVHIMAPGDARTPEVLASARRAAVATDSRFLRVLDAVHSDLPDIGSYVVCEYAPGITIEEILQRGPISALEAGWIVRELADALSIVHSMGIYHECLNPNTVVITEAGQVRIVGLLTEYALRPAPDDDKRSEADREACDVESLGKLLYAMLVTRWPGGYKFGLPPAPTENGRWLTPRQVRAGVSPALDQVCDQILSRPPRGKAQPLRTANEVLRALQAVLGHADASPDLEKRLAPHEPVSVVPPVPVASFAPAASRPPQRAKVSAPVPADDGPMTEPMSLTDIMGADLRGEPTDRTRFTPVPQPARAAIPWDDYQDDVGGTTTQDPFPGARRAAEPRRTPRPATPAGERRRSRTWIPVVVLLVLAALIALASWAGISAVVNAAKEVPGPTKPSMTSQVPPKAVEIKAGKDFDPRGDQQEHPDKVALAFDKDPTTAWTTERYNTPNYDGKKPGTGFYVDLGQPVNVTQVKLTLSGGEGQHVGIWVPADANTAEPPATIDGWREVASSHDTRPDVVLQVKDTKTRYVLVWFTGVPKVKDNIICQAVVYEIEVDT